MVFLLLSRRQRQHHAKKGGRKYVPGRLGASSDSESGPKEEEGVPAHHAAESVMRVKAIPTCYTIFLFASFGAILI